MGTVNNVALVITTCTGSKAQAAPHPHRVSTLGRGTVAELGKAWGVQIAQGARIPAHALYAGRAFQIPARLGAARGDRVLIVSAGLGLIDADSQVPPYECTVLSGKHDSIAARASDPFTPAIWWRVVQSVSPFALDLAHEVAASKGLILAALSEAYLEMLSADLLALPAKDLARLRLFTRAPRSRVPQALRPALMPYDDRLDGKDSGHRGTRDNFAARALAHFATCILESQDERSAAEHAVAVERAIADWRWPEKVERRSASDAEIMDLMITHWEATGGVASRLLKLLRNEFFIRCEQGRCRDLTAFVRERLA